MDAVQKAHALACDVRLKAYAPYSGFKVGAVFKLKGLEQYVTGANVENASFGATVCAERIAIFSAIKDMGKIEFEFLVVVTDLDEPAPPCGLCLQVMAEFCSPDLPVYLANTKEIKKTTLFKELLPQSFTEFKV